MNPFPFADYKKYLTDFIDSTEGRGAKAALAEAAGCQRSFLSQVLNGETHLTLEHAIGIAHYLRLDSAQTEYFYCLVAHARSGTPALRHYYADKMKSLRWASEGSRPSARVTESDAQAEYYSSWKFAAVHMAVTIPGLRTAAQIAKRLRLETLEVEGVLRKLKSWGFIELHRQEWTPSKKLVHLPDDHFMNATNHRNWRTKNLDLFEREAKRGVMYSAVYSMSRSDFEALRDMIYRFLGESRKLVAASANEEELVSFALDCLPL